MFSFSFTLLLIGQCGPGGCSSPGFSQPFSQPFYQPSYVRQVAPPPRVAAPVRREPPPAISLKSYPMRTYSIVHEGLTFEVYGYVRDNNGGRVTWDQNEEVNRVSFAAAKAKASAVVATPTPKARNVGQFDPANGVEPSRSHHVRTPLSEDANRFIREAKADDAETHNLHVTVIGADADRKEVVNDIQNHPAFASIKGSLLVQDYRPDEWPVDPALKFVTNGKPTILVQTPKSPRDPNGGRVIYRAADYSMGPEALAEAIRKANPHYDPSADPGPATSKTSVCPLGFERDHLPFIAATGVGLIFLVRLPRKGA